MSDDEAMEDSKDGDADDRGVEDALGSVEEDGDEGVAADYSDRLSDGFRDRDGSSGDDLDLGDDDDDNSDAEGAARAGGLEELQEENARLHTVLERNLESCKALLPAVCT